MSFAIIQITKMEIFDIYTNRRRLKYLFCAECMSICYYIFVWFETNYSFFLNLLFFFLSFLSFSDSFNGSNRHRVDYDKWCVNKTAAWPYSINEIRLENWLWKCAHKYKRRLKVLPLENYPIENVQLQQVPCWLAQCIYIFIQKRTTPIGSTHKYQYIQSNHKMPITFLC